MSDYKKEIEDIKKMVKSLASQLEGREQSFTKYSNIETDTLSDVSLHSSPIINRDELIQQVRNKDKLITDLQSENSTLKKLLNKESVKRKEIEDLLKKHESKMRQLFDAFKQEQNKDSDNQYRIAELQYRLHELKGIIDQKDEQLNRLKNQLSYRLGSKIVGLKNRKNFLSLPKEVLDEYIDFKSNLMKNSKGNNNQIELHPILTLPTNSKLATKLFEETGLVSLKPQYNSLIFQSKTKGAFELELYGVKPGAVVEIEVKIEALGDGCVLSLSKDKEEIFYLEQNQTIYSNLTITDSLIYDYIKILSNEGGIKIGFKKIRGVPSYIRVNKVDNTQLKNVREENKPVKSKIDIKKLPPLVKPNATLYEAEQLVSTLGKDTALAFAKKNIKNRFRPALNVFNANLVLGQDKLWLKYINDYLASFNCSPIKLSKGDKPLYYRIKADRPKDIEGETKVSIIMPAFNAENTIENAMNSVLNQTWKNIELIVVNDCSEDRTWECIQRVSSKDNRVIAINNPSNVGAYVSKNIGLQLATGDYITGHDSDDWAHPQRIENHLNAINSEETKPRASLTRMIRMEENGYFPFYLEGTFCLDGVLRVASITCMFEADFLRNTLGGWDCSRFGADSEIIARAKIVLEDEFKDYHQMSMICLDAPNSLTNNPVHGVQRGKGLSPSRKFYKEQWSEWHKTLTKDNVYLEFPHLVRRFDVPAGTEIPKQNILQAIENIEESFDL